MTTTPNITPITPESLVASVAKGASTRETGARLDKSQDFAKVLNSVSSRDNDAQNKTDDAGQAHETTKSTKSTKADKPSRKDAQDKDATNASNDTDTDKPAATQSKGNADNTSTATDDAPTNDGEGSLTENLTMIVDPEGVVVPVTTPTTDTAAADAAQQTVATNPQTPTEVPTVAPKVAPTAKVEITTVAADGKLVLAPTAGTVIDVTTDDPSAAAPKLIDPNAVATAPEDTNATNTPTTSQTGDNTTQVVQTTVDDPTATLRDAIADAGLLTTTTTDGKETKAAVTASISEVSNKHAMDLLAATSQKASAEPVQQANTMKAAVATPTTEPYKQVVNVVAPLRHMADGDYQMTLRLHPEHLGRVEIAVTLTNGQINMQMSSDNSAARQMLRDAMGDLRSSLESSGLQTGSLDVGARDSNQGSQQGSQPGSRSSYGEPIDNSTEQYFVRIAAPVTETSATDGPLDVRV